MRKSIYILFLILVVSGCNGKISPEKRGIRLNVGVSGLDTETKAPFVDVPSNENQFKAFVWFSNTPGTYPVSPSEDENLPNRIVSTFISENATDIKDESGKLLQYPISNGGKTKVYCTGFYPSDGWSIVDDSQNPYSVTHAIDGESDLMFAEQIAGSYQENFGDFTFKHLLTWISFNASATSVDAAAIWGNITKLTITTPQSSLTVTLSGSIGTPSTVNYSGETSVITVTETSTPLSIKAVDLGSALCSPPYSKVIDSKTYYGYDISVSTYGIGTKAIFVPLYDTDSQPITDPQAAIGKQYVISLYFNEVSVVSGVCTLKYWEDEREDLYVDRPVQAS